MVSWLVAGIILQQNQGEEFWGPQYGVKTGKTPVLTEGEMKELLDSIDTSEVVGLRDRALIATMLFASPESEPS
ncbi:MAG: hypothetical protein AB4050_03110 [Synechococcus sp.]